MAAINKALEFNNLIEAARLINEAETELPSLDSSEKSSQIRANLGCLMIDLGDWTNDEQLVARGTQYVQDALEIPLNIKLKILHLYNAGNGYASIWKMKRSVSWGEGKLNLEYLEAKNLFRQAIDLLKQHPDLTPSEQKQKLYVNYANTLDSHARFVEAIEYYDLAISLNPLMGEALGNKAMALFFVFRLMRGYRHLFLLESKSLLESALRTSLHVQMTESFRADLERITRIIDSHKDLQAEQISETKPRSPFQAFLHDFCTKHHLFLTPTTFLSARGSTVHGDPMFISQMTAPLNDKGKFSRYITFMNQIKQDYVLTRYFLVQSQYQSDIVDTIDEGVSLYYPLDYSLDGAYIHLLKTSLRLALDVLDKIANFIRDYCSVALQDDQVNFRNVFSSSASPDLLRPELQQFSRNRLIFALFDLSRDLSKDGYYASVYKRRNVLTHRFLVVHDMIVSDENADIPRVHLNEFRKECITAMQIARAAVMYLILFVDAEELKHPSGGVFPMPAALPIDHVLRWKPAAGEKD